MWPKHLVIWMKLPKIAANNRNFDDKRQQLILPFFYSNAIGIRESKVLNIYNFDQYTPVDDRRVTL